MKAIPLADQKAQTIAIITKCLVGTGSSWQLYIAPEAFAMNCQVSQITGFSPFQMVYSKPPPDKLAFDYDPTKSGIKIDTPLYMLFMEQGKLLIDHGYAVGDLVLINHSPNSVLKAPSRKLKRG